MEGGAIEGNTAYSEYTYGGGVYVGNGAQFTMEGGAITGNTAKATNTANGGGVYVGGTFHMSGGTIAENTAEGDTAYVWSVAYGGGVYVTNAFHMSGGTIAENTLETNGFASYSGINMYIMSTFHMSGGYMENEANSQDKISGSGTISVTGGYFASSPSSNFLADGHTAVNLSADTDHYGDTGYKDGYPYAVYQNGDTSGYSVSKVNTTYGLTYTPAVSGTTATPSYSYTVDGATHNGLPSNAGIYTVTAAFDSSIDGASKTYIRSRHSEAKGSSSRCQKQSCI